MAQGPISQARGRSSIEDKVRAAYFTPSPYAYDPKKPEKGCAGKISRANVPSALDQQPKEKSFVPGPGSYETPDLGDFALPEGGRLNRAPPQEKFKLDECPIPPPGTYGVPNDPTVPRNLYGSFGKDPRITKFIDEEVKRSRSVPAPGEHEVMESMESMRPFCPEGGRYLEQIGRNNGYFDNATRIGEGNPEPGRYSLPGAIRSNKSAGKLVWKYQSETMEKTKQIITKVVGNPNENPAPGHYTLPDPQPLAPAPTMKGRDTGVPMPHPFAYNCAPDHARKFDSFTPVREQNSGDQIYGRDLRKGALSRPARAKAAADEVAAAHMPIELAERDIEKPGETAQWRSGGFAALRRPRSVPIIEKRLHPALEATMHNYPALSRFHGRRDRTFTPMAIKRPEIVKMNSNSREYEGLQRKKWMVGAIADEITAAASSVFEPLDEQKLRASAMHGLIDKAKFRMRMEGLAPEQQELVLKEFPQVFTDSTHANPPPSDSAVTSTILSESRIPDSAAAAAAEPFAEPLPIELSS
jgi:hypothetical protein